MARRVIVIFHQSKITFPHNKKYDVPSKTLLSRGYSNEERPACPLDLGPRISRPLPVTIGLKPDESDKIAQAPGHRGAASCRDFALMPGVSLLSPWQSGHQEA